MYKLHNNYIDKASLRNRSNIYKEVKYGASVKA